MQYDNTNKGSAWNVDRKLEDWHADAKGSLNVEGKEYWLDITVNKSDNPKAPHYKVSVRSKQPKSQPKDYADKAPNEDVPF